MIRRPALAALRSCPCAGPRPQVAATATSTPSSLPRLLHTTPPSRSAWPVSFSGSGSDVGNVDTSEGHLGGGPGSAPSGSQERRSTRLQQTGPIDRTDAGSSKARHRLEMPQSRPAKTIAHLWEMKQRGTPITCLTAYDYPTALSLRHSDVDLCLVGDSLANVALGHASTQSLTLDATIHHCQAVHRGLFSPVLSVSPHTPAAPLLIADIPFGTFQTSDDEGVRSAVRILKEGGADGIKIEGGAEILPLVRRLTAFGIPVMGHLGLQPQRVASSAGYRLQGRTADEAAEILRDALALQEAGAFSIVLECIPNRVGELITRKLSIPTIGIGAGPQCDGQILVTNDMLGELTSPWHVIVGLEGEGGEAGEAEEGGASTQSQEQQQQPQPSKSIPLPQPQNLPRLRSPAPSGPKFVRNFLQEVVSPPPPATSASSSSTSGSGPTFNPAAGVGIGAMRLAAVEAYVRAVRERTFPDEGREGYKMKSGEWREFVRRAEGKGGGE